jgi:diaminopimelate decarboxylase
VDPRLERIAKNEEVFRAANREIERAEQEQGAAADGMLEVICECGRDSCSGVITLTVSEYDTIHSQEDRFVVLRGHQSENIERVVDDRGDYLVVDKVGEAEEIVEDDTR